MPVNLRRRMAVVMTAWGVSVLTLASPAAGQVTGHVSLVPVPAPPEWRGLDGTATPSIAWLGDTALVRIDAAEHQVIVTRLRDGEVRRVGRLGGGPGEFRTPFQLITDARGRIAVEDPSNQRVTIFGPDLRYLSSLTAYGGRNVLLLRLDPGRLTVLYSPPMESPSVGDVDISGDRLTDRFEVFARDTSIRSMITAGSRQFPSGFVGAIITRRGEIIIGNPLTYRMTAFAPNGTPLRRFGRPEIPVAMETPAEAATRSGRLRRDLDGVRGSVASDRQLSLLANQAEKPRAKPHFEQAALATDTAGRLWVATTRVKGGMTEIDLFDSTGRFVQTVRVSDRVRALAVRLPLVAVLVERLKGDEEGLDGIDLYRVRENRE